MRLEAPCIKGDGILALTETTKLHAIKYFQKESGKTQVAFFIPASGSGSRMFDVLYAHLDNLTMNENLSEAMLKFVQQANQFAFFELLSDSNKTKLQTKQIDLISFIKYLLFDEGLNFGTLPKGLIPFHKYSSTIRNPFQEHLIQGTQITDTNALFHFTINGKFENLITKSIQNLEAETKSTYNYTFSVQDPATDANSFDSNLTPLKSTSGEFITRPAGHGALLQNLNSIDADIIFIRNIDNVQHFEKAENSIQTRKALAGILLDIRHGIFEVLKDLENDISWNSKLKDLSDQYQLNFPIDKIKDKNFVLDFLHRPVRVCGMVKNLGQPGGGPFWVKNKDGIRAKQIVEKSQISNDPSQQNILLNSTHFNPVEIVCSIKDQNGKKFDLKKFSNENLFFIVQKTHEGKPIQYIEEPGLWNGGMDNWLTIFYEIDSSCFSPVKTFFDLLESPHQAL